MKKVLSFIAILALGQSASAEIVASQVTCAQLKYAVDQGENYVIGKTGKVYSMISDCGVSYFFRTANGLCHVGKAGSADWSVCAPQYDNGNNGGGN